MQHFNSLCATLLGWTTDVVVERIFRRVLSNYEATALILAIKLAALLKVTASRLQ